MHDDMSPSRPASELPSGAPDSDTPAGAGGQPADLETQLASALAESAQTKDALLRALADTENIRKRSMADVAGARKYAIEDFATNLLAVKDTLEMAVNDKTSTIEQLRMGVELTLKNLAAAFEKAKIAEVDPRGQKFDPTKHQAVSHIESDQPANTVVQVFQKGYLLHDRVLRPAMVAVAKGQESAAPAPENPIETKGL
jgi:molecular chaperone GrpE